MIGPDKPRLKSAGKNLCYEMTGHAVKFHANSVAATIHIQECKSGQRW